MRVAPKFAIAVALVVSSASVGSVRATDDPGGPLDSGGAGDRLELYTGDVSFETLADLRAGGFDITDTKPGSAAGTVTVEVVVSATDLVELDEADIPMEPVTDVFGQTTSRSATVEADDGFEVWRSYGEPGGIRDEIVQLAKDNPKLLKLVSIGRTVNGKAILALKLTRNANRVQDGSRPSVLYSSAQHAREWITVETNRRLLHHYIDNYDTDRDIRQLVNRNELWFVLVANPDGYDYTFTEGQRLWRKNLADNNADGVINTLDGVDLNRNWPVKWGYDNEGSSPEPASPTYRGTGPASEPETRALDGLMADIDFDFQVNYHSAAELLLYGIGWQVATPSPDDIVYAALAGDDENPAVEGYDPDLSAELYTTNGETTEHAHTTYGTLAYTPELDTCDSAEAIFPDDEFGDDYCETDGRSVFEFPDDEELVQAVFDKNLDFALSVARSAKDPTKPQSSVGLEAPDFVVDSFDVSYSGDQTVAVEAPRDSYFKRMYYRVNDGRIRSTPVSLWNGGERYGGDLDFYYGEYRGDVRGAQIGDDVEVFFTSFDITRRGRFGIPRFDFNLSEPFNYEVQARGDAPVLILANEDQLGFGPVQDSATPKYVDTFGAALAANGVDYDVWDVATQGVPHPLGVLSHYDGVVWELGDNRLTQEEGDTVTQTPNGPFPDVSVAEVQQFTTIAIRDYLNEGGKVAQSGEYTAYFGELAGALGGAYYALNGDTSADCVVTESFFDDCLIYSDDFSQYYQGVFQRTAFGAPSAVIGVGGSLDGRQADIDGEETPDSGAFLVTSEVLPIDQFPQFASEKFAEYVFDGPAPFAPFEGEGYAAAAHADNAWMRLSQTVDLTSASSSASLSFKASIDTEGGYDHAVIEVRPVGTEDWTTLPDAATEDGGTSTGVPAECEAGFFFDVHPDLANYLTLGAPCTATGATGEWNSFTGSTGGWTDVKADLGDYIGQELEVSISYITDPGSGGTGVFVDNTVTTVDGSIVDENGFEDGLGSWSVPGPPATSPGNATDWVVGPALFDTPAAIVRTEDTITFGFGFEAIANAQARAVVMGAVLSDLFGLAPSPA